MVPREDLVYRAKLAEQAERFDEMVADMKEVAKQDMELSVEERNLLSVAYKNVIGSRRASWRVMSSIEHKCEVDGSDKIGIVKDYKVKIEDELTEICNDILNIVESNLIPRSSNAEASVFLLFLLRACQTMFCTQPHSAHENMKHMIDCVSLWSDAVLGLLAAALYIFIIPVRP